MHIKQKVFHGTILKGGVRLRKLPGECVCMAKNAPFKTKVPVGHCGLGATVSESGVLFPPRKSSQESVLVWI